MEGAFLFGGTIEFMIDRKPQWTKFERTDVFDLSEKNLREQAELVGISYEEMVRAWEHEKSLTISVWINNIYQVKISKVKTLSKSWPPMLHLSIKRIDKEPIHDWRDLQKIKNELVGPEHEALELYPAESRVVDMANQYHLWVFKDPEVVIPVGWDTGMKIGKSGGGSKQRPF
jgi:hypothetical protein